ncbi:MAG TPA: transcription termination/antitermination NusG family protein [Roseiarcus sp.]|nr:transcription termination/antitermination NusG family protein [Roseiarcus sp.]
MMNRAGNAADAGKSFELIDGERWYVAHTPPHKEAVATMHLGEQGFRTFLPRRLKNIRHARTMRTILAPVFPRYLFLILNLDRDRWLSVNGTRGISRLIMVSGRPVPVPSGIVETLIAASDPAGKVKYAPGVAKGEKVRLVAGPFADCLGVIECLNDSGRVSLLLKIMNREVRVTTTHDWLEPLVA